MTTNVLPKLEQQHLDSGHLIIGVDEVGRGCLAGPVYASACILDYSALLQLEAKPFAWVRDSKTLSAKQRIKMLEVLNGCTVAHATARAETEEIDNLNILQASFLAMKRAVLLVRKKIQEKIAHKLGAEASNFMVLVDGRQPIPKLGLPQAAVIGGDASVKAIAAASIFAKQARDGLMQEMDTRYPGYGFAKNVGYGTKQHMTALQKLGPIAIHRKSFGPVKRSLFTRS
jgi:ribonuclease HII